MMIMSNTSDKCSRLKDCFGVCSGRKYDGRNPIGLAGTLDEE